MPVGYNVDYQYIDSSDAPVGSSGSLTISGLVVNQTSVTEVEITFSKLEASVQPTSVEITTQRLLDNGSNDGSKEIIEKFTHIKSVLRKKNLGFGKSVMSGINKAKGKYLLFDLKSIALEKGIGCKLSAFWSIEANKSSD
jgi:hypothetical protein